VQTRFLDRHPGVKDTFGIIIFVICVLIGTLLINAFIFRSFNVDGRSMEETMHNGDRLIVDRLPITWSQLQNKQYVPDRGQIIVFKNPSFDDIKNKEEYVVKRVIAFEGERVVLKDGSYIVFNDKHPEGFDPDDANNGEPGAPTSGEVDEVVPENTLFVSGDHRQGQNSLDSRNGLGFIPLYDVIGPVSLRIFPFDQIRNF
jgi:signal peptidase I